MSAHRGNGIGTGIGILLLMVAVGAVAFYMLDPTGFLAYLQGLGL